MCNQNSVRKPASNTSSDLLSCLLPNVFWVWTPVHGTLCEDKVGVLLTSTFPEPDSSHHCTYLLNKCMFSEETILSVRSSTSTWGIHLSSGKAQREPRVHYLGHHLPPWHPHHYTGWMFAGSLSQGECLKIVLITLLSVPSLKSCNEGFQEFKGRRKVPFKKEFWRLQIKEFMLKESPSISFVFVSLGPDTEQPHSFIHSLIEHLVWDRHLWDIS